MSSQLFWLVLQNVANVYTYTKRSPYLTSLNQPDEIKTYPGKEYLFASRIFRPANSPNKLPLVIRVHGGGFIMNNPAVDDALSRYLADEAGCVVVSIDYRKAPRHVFPAGYEDVIDMSLTVIADQDLNINTSKVILSGTSAGGELVLAAAQDRRLRSKVMGIMAVTPVVDFVPTFEEKMATRPDPSVPDFLQGNYNGMLGVYTGGTKVDIRDIRLSPIYFSKREDLPEHIYINAAEHDLLWKEAENMAEKLAQGGPKTVVESGWEAGTVKWNLIKGCKHAFEAFPEKDPQADAARQLAVKTMFRSIADWVKKVTSV